ncbi:MAG: D-aminoacyl-tRNA deacylase [Planctomycetota bacterium]
MRAVVQRVSQASVHVDGTQVGEIGHGLLVLLGVEEGDAEKDLNYLINKTSGLRVFEDDAGLMNRSIQEAGGSILAISQFTLLGDVRKGKRPSFITAAKPDEANVLYERYCAGLRELGLQVEQGVFQADMKVSLVNDGPVTILLDSRKLF